MMNIGDRETSLTIRVQDGFVNRVFPQVRALGQWSDAETKRIPEQEKRREDLPVTNGPAVRRAVGIGILGLR